MQESAFTTVGFNDWKHAIERFKGHEESSCHRDALYKTTMKNRPDVAAMLLNDMREKQQQNRVLMLKQLSTVRTLARQGLALRGHCEGESNLQQFLNLRSEDCNDLKSWLSNAAYLSHDIVNEQIDIMGQNLLRNILADIRDAQFFAVIADEVRDVSNHEQLGISIRWVDKEMEVQESFIGLIDLPKCDAATITSVIRDILLRCSLPIVMCRGQAYDGAPTMAGHINGVAAQIQKEEPRAIYVHCLAHSLNLVLQDTTRRSHIIRDVLELCMGISQLINWSPKRFHLFKEKQREFNTTSKIGVRPLCPTRWTVRAEAISAVLQNYETLMHTLAEINEEQHDEYGLKASGYLALLEKFEILFGLRLGYIVFGASEEVSKTLQAVNTTIQDAQKASEAAKQFFLRQRSAEKFDELYDQCINEASKYSIGEPGLPRYRRPPRKIDDGTRPHQYPTPRNYFRQKYYEVIDTIITQLDQRFGQKSLSAPLAIEQMLLDAANGENCTIPEVVRKSYEGDIDTKRMIHQLHILHDFVMTSKPELKKVT